MSDERACDCKPSERELVFAKDLTPEQKAERRLDVIEAFLRHQGKVLLALATCPHQTSAIVADLDDLITRPLLRLT